MALYIPHNIFHLARLLYVRPETFGPYYVTHLKKHFAVLSNCFLLSNSRITTSLIHKESRQEIQTNQQLQCFRDNSPCPGS